MLALDGKHVFVLEDDFLNLTVIMTILKGKGAKVYSDVWGTNTLNQLKYLPQVDLILLDLMLERTRLSGYEIFDQIKAEPKLEKVPVVLVTAADPDVELKKAQDKGFNGFFSKPLDRITFAEQIASILEGEKVWSPR